MPAETSPGYLIPIGGAEDKHVQRLILSRFLELSGGEAARIVVVPAASAMPAEIGATYHQIFTDLKAASVQVLDLRSRTEANDPACIEPLDAATGVFLTGGDQVKLVSLLAGTAFGSRLHARYMGGVTIAGTSAGASALSEHMIAFGRSGARPAQRMVNLAPGLGLINRLLIDQHFRERDRVGRLMAAVAMNPAIIGIGIDEDTALIIGPDHTCTVIGSGSVTIVDGSELDYTDIHSVKQHGPVAVLGMKVHILTSGYHFNIETRHPGPPAAR